MHDKSTERCEAILEVATNLFSLQGYKNTDVQQIADTLQIGKGTIYRHFSTKEALFFATVDRAMLKMENFIKEQIRQTQDDIDRIKGAIKSYITFFRRHPEFIELFIQERAEFRQRDVPTYLSHRAKRDSEWSALFERIHAKGKTRSDHFDWSIDFITTLLYGIMFTKVFQDDRNRLLERGDEYLDMLLYGIFIPEGKL